MGISAWADPAFGQSNLRNPGLLETLLYEHLTLAGVHTTSLSSLLDTWESDTRSHRENARSNLLPREVPLSCRGTHHFLNKPHGSAATPYQALLCAVMPGGESVLHRDTQVAQGQMPIPVTHLTCRSQVCALIVM